MFARHFVTDGRLEMARGRKVTMPEPTLRIAMICTGNICRSPMAEVIMRHEIAEDPFLIDRVSVSSAGTANWHVGAPMDPRARTALDAAGVDLEGTPATYADASYLNNQDVIVVMTREHVHEVASRLTNRSARVVMLRNLLSPGLDLDVADPYYGSQEDFARCLEMLTAGARCLISEFRQRMGADSLES
jgi:protein-tyrosine phosphatase